MNYCCMLHAKYFVETVPGFCKIVVSINFTLKARKFVNNKSFSVKLLNQIIVYTE